MFETFLVAPDEFKSGWPYHCITLDKVHRLFVTVSSFRSDRFVQLPYLIPF